MPLRNIIEKFTPTVGKRNEIEQIMSAELIIHRLLGQHILDPKWSWFKFIHYHLALICLGSYGLFASFHFTKQPEYNNGLLGELCYIMLLSIFAPCKVFTHYYFREVFIDVFIATKTEIFEIIKAESTENSVNVLRKIKKIRFYFSIAISAAAFSFIPEVAWNYAKGVRVSMLKATSLAFGKAPVFHEISILIQAILIFEVASIFYILDLWFMLYTYLFCVACDSVTKMLMVEEKGDQEDSESYARRLRESLGLFYRNHIKLVKFLQQLNELYKWQALIPIMCTALFLCIIFLAFSVTINLDFAPLLLPVICEVFVYSLLGEQVKTKVNNLKNAVLNFDWPSLEKTDKKSYFIIVTFMNTEMGLKTVIGHELSMLTMAIIMKSSYKVFSLLIQTTN